VRRDAKATTTGNRTALVSASNARCGFSDASSTSPQLSLNARAPVALAALGVHFGDLRGELGVLEGAFRRRTMRPRVIAAARHSEHAAHHGDRPLRLLRADERKLHVLSFAKKAVAFF